MERITHPLILDTPSRVVDHANLDACSDCLMFIANGEVPDDNPDNWDPARIDSEWGEVSERTAKFHGASPNQLRWEIVCGGEHENEFGEGLGFSWSSCDCCGSTLGGDRHALTALLVRVRGNNEGS